MLATNAPPPMLESIVYFAQEYLIACSRNPKMNPVDASKKFLKAVEFGVKYGMGENKYTGFGSTHTALRGGEETNPEGDTDFYEFGCDFFRNVIDLETSVVLGEENARRAFAKIKAGENVVFLANHQSEADPQVFSTLLETIGLGEEASEVMYVAGHKVTTDALAIPFSMGRNLLCIHSKKHIDAEPELKSVKQRQNLASMSALLSKLRNGGLAVWVAPSGGRDRRNVETNEVPLAPFHYKTVDMFRLMGNKSKVKTHFFPLAMASYDLCPPPDNIEFAVGEQRNVQFSSIGIAMGKEVPNVGGVDQRHLFTDHAFDECEEDYSMLLKAIADKKSKMSIKTIMPPPPL